MSQESDLKPLSPSARDLVGAWIRPVKLVSRLPYQVWPILGLGGIATQMAFDSGVFDAQHETVYLGVFGQFFEIALMPFELVNAMASSGPMGMALLLALPLIMYMTLWPLARGPI